MSCVYSSHPNAYMESGGSALLYTDSIIDREEYAGEVDCTGGSEVKWTVLEGSEVKWTVLEGVECIGMSEGRVQRLNSFDGVECTLGHKTIGVLHRRTILTPMTTDGG